MDFYSFNKLIDSIERQDSEADKLNKIHWGLDGVRIEREKIQSQLEGLNKRLRDQDEYERILKDIHFR